MIGHLGQLLQLVWVSCLGTYFFQCYLFSIWPHHNFTRLFGWRHCVLCANYEQNLIDSPCRHLWAPCYSFCSWQWSFSRLHRTLFWARTCYSFRSRTRDEEAGWHSSNCSLHHDSSPAICHFRYLILLPYSSASTEVLKVHSPTLFYPFLEFILSNRLCLF